MAAKKTPPKTIKAGKRGRGRPKKGEKSRAELEAEIEELRGNREGSEKPAPTPPAAPASAPTSGPVLDPLEEPVVPPPATAPKAEEKKTADEDDDAPAGGAQRLGDFQARILCKALFNAADSLALIPLWAILKKRWGEEKAAKLYASACVIVRLTPDERDTLEEAIAPKLARLELSEDEQLIVAIALIYGQKLIAIIAIGDPEAAARVAEAAQAASDTQREMRIVKISRVASDAAE